MLRSSLVCRRRGQADGGTKSSRLVKMSDRDEVGPSGLSVKEVDIADCPVHSVVVYPDRAEVSHQAC